MAVFSDSAICLRCWDFSETSQTVCLLTKENGLIRGLAKGSKRDNGSFSGGFDPLTRGNVVARTKRSSDLATLTEWQLDHVWWSARKDLQINQCAIYMLDIIFRMITDQDPHTNIYETLLTTLDRIERGHDYDWSLLRFQWSLLVETGYQPKLETVCETEQIVAFSSKEGGVVKDTGEIDRVRVRKETIEILRTLLDDRPNQPAEPEVLNRANRLLAHYIRDIIGKDTAAMRWMWN
ncbi:MAG: DNA repair protein RecO [Phycisphaerales bacterium]|jgi:DNA repair protein RecO (recombination protein O)|nr:DNA repair protein RecO [Phycisphaerales bacterium]